MATSHRAQHSVSVVSDMFQVISLNLVAAAGPVCLLPLRLRRCCLYLLCAAYSEWSWHAHAER